MTGRTILSLALALALAGLSPLCAEEAPQSPAAKPSAWNFHSELDLYMGLKAGAEYRFNDSLGLRGSVGVCLINMLITSYSLVGIEHFLAPKSRLQLDLQFGLIQATFNGLELLVYSDPQTRVHWISGACAAIGYRTKGGHVFSVRAGGGCDFGYDNETWLKPSFMPNIGIEYDFKP